MKNIKTSNPIKKKFPSRPKKSCFGFPSLNFSIIESKIKTKPRIIEVSWSNECRKDMKHDPTFVKKTNRKKSK